MGSSCSILNDTEYDVWINHGINWTVLIASVGSVAALLTAGMGLAALGAWAGVGGALAGGGALIMAEEGIIMGTTATTLAGLTATQWTVAGIATSLSTSALATTLNISAQEAARIQKYVSDFQEASELIKPGEKYTWSGTLSLTKRVYVMNDKLQIGDKACFTGATADSENVYTISKHFTTLDVKKEPNDMNISAQEADRVQKDVSEFQETSELIKPSEKYTSSGTVMNDKLQIGDNACFTGAENISKHFKKQPNYILSI